MNRDTLSLLGCSGSLAFVLLAGNAAKADALALQSEASAISPTPVAAQTADTPHVQVALDELQYASIDADSDAVGDLAIAKFKCDCMACRKAVVQMLQTGQASL